MVGSAATKAALVFDKVSGLLSVVHSGDKAPRAETPLTDGGGSVFRL